MKTKNDTENTKTSILIDPPSGWKYGFPMVYDIDETTETLIEWLVRKGYPANQADFAAQHSRMWVSGERHNEY